METNGLLPGMGSGMLGLEMPIHHPHHPHHQHPHPHQQQQQQQHPFANHLQQQQPHHLVSFGIGGHEADPHNQSQQAVKQNAYGFGNKPKQPQQVAISDEDEPGFAGEDGGGADGRKRVSPWQRVKWTDNMVRLLIMVVYYVGDDAGPEGNDLNGGGNCKKKSGGLLQKKGKWKSVSRAMMEKGFYVSPQQCEDKFNDLNKRYKRVNDIIGKGTACRVVENQALLETLDHIPPKLKEEVKKLLNSKHLFFREMCAYHNSGGGGGGGVASGGVHQIPDASVESASQHHQQDRCFHSSQSAAANGNSRARADLEGLKMVSKRGISHDEEEDEDVEDEDDCDEDEEEDEDDDEENEDGGKSHRLQGGGHEDEDVDEKMARKRQRRGTFPSVSPSIQQLSCELMNVLQDGSKNPWEQRKWMRTRTVQLEEQRVSYQCQAFELEKQRLKWLKFSGKKERELERMKLNNERLRLENDRMVLLLRQKELELVDLHQQQHSSSKPTSMN